MSFKMATINILKNREINTVQSGSIDISSGLNLLFYLSEYKKSGLLSIFKNENVILATVLIKDGEIVKSGTTTKNGFKAVGELLHLNKFQYRFVEI
jgi:hypothetical protein